MKTNEFDCDRDDEMSDEAAAKIIAYLDSPEGKSQKEKENAEISKWVSSWANW